MNKNITRLATLKRYYPLLRQLVTKDIKLKYRRSFLGYLWSVLNPLLIMLIMMLVFSHMFRFDIQNFPVYLITGQLIFNFITDSTNQSISSIVGNAALLKKTYVPKYIFTFAKVTSCLVNTVFSLGALFVVMLISRVKPNLYMLWIPFVFLQVYFFAVGIGMFLAAANVFFRDIQYLWNAFITAWMYLTPIFYPVTMLPVWFQRVIKILNPAYPYIYQFRTVIIDAAFPDPRFIVYGTVYAMLTMLLGIGVFLKTQDNFILYI